MIVNTAYIYMGSGGAPVNPNLWQNGVSNYPVEFTKDSSISSDGLVLTSRGGSATFSELRLTGFNSLTISLPQGTKFFFTETTITIEFLNSAGQMLGTETVTYKAFATVNPQTVNIPSPAKTQNAKIRITNSVAMNNYIITLSSALLS